MQPLDGCNSNPWMDSDPRPNHRTLVLTITLTRLQSLIFRKFSIRCITSYMHGEATVSQLTDRRVRGLVRRAAEVATSITRCGTYI